MLIILQLKIQNYNTQKKKKILEQMSKQNFKCRKHVNIKSYCLTHANRINQRNTAPNSKPKRISHTCNSSLSDTQFQVVLGQNLNSTSILDSCKLLLKKKQDDNQIFKMHKMLEKTFDFYKKALDFFKHNENKLLEIIYRQLTQRNYQCRQQIMSFLRDNHILTPQPQNQFSILQSQLSLLNEFLSQIYLARKKKEITVIYDSIIDQERMLAKKTNMLEYDEIYSHLHVRSSNISNFDFISHYQSICQKFGSKQGNVRPHYELKSHLQKCIDRIKQTFLANKRQKQKRKYIFGQNSQNSDKYCR